MLRWVVGIVTLIAMTSGLVLMASGSDTPAPLPEAPSADLLAAPMAEDAVRTLPKIPELPEAPQADPLSKEEKRFNRVDKDSDEIITLSELVHPRRNRYANLDLDKDGVLSFEEWAITTIEKFEGADADGNGQLTRTEYATTAPKPRKPKPTCRC